MAIYGRKTDSSRMGSYEGSGGMSDMFDALGGAVEKYRDVNLNPAQEEQVEGPTGKVTPAKKAYYGEYVGPDFMKGKSMGEAFGNVRKYFGDRLNSMKKYGKPIGGITPTTKVEPVVEQATMDANEDNAITLDEKTGIENMAGPTASVPAKDHSGLSFDPSQTPLNSLKSEQLSEWGKHMDIKDPTMSQYANWQKDLQNQPKEAKWGSKEWLEEIQSQTPKNEDGSPKVIAGTAPLPFLDGFGGIGEAWQGAKSLWGALTK